MLRIVISRNKKLSVDSLPHRIAKVLGEELRDVDRKRLAKLYDEVKMVQPRLLGQAGTKVDQ